MSALHSLIADAPAGIKPGLDAIRAAMHSLGDPQNSLAAIHIAGTDGKGAVAALCESVLREAGYPVARYTSPHLLSVNERFFVDGAPVADDLLEEAAAEVLPVAKGLTFFERLTAVAFVLFRNLGRKLVVLETGLGGRLDATNLVTPLCSVITRIGLDHCAWLGPDIPSIAGEKAGIIKAGRPAVIGRNEVEAMEVFAARAKELGAPLVLAEDVSVRRSKVDLSGQTLRISTTVRELPPIRLPLAGEFQAENAATAAAALETVSSLGLPVPDEAFIRGFQSVQWPGRFQQVKNEPTVIVDGGHNTCAAKALYCELKRLKSVALVTGLCADKECSEFLRTLQSLVRAAWAVPVPNPRTMEPDSLAALMRQAGMKNAVAKTSLEDALAEAEAFAKAEGCPVLVCGSLFLAGQAVQHYNAWPWAVPRIDQNERL